MTRKELQDILAEWEINQANKCNECVNAVWRVGVTEQEKYLACFCEVLHEEPVGVQVFCSAFERREWDEGKAKQA